MFPISSLILHILRIKYCYLPILTLFLSRLPFYPKVTPLYCSYISISKLLNILVKVIWSLIKDIYVLYNSHI